MAADPNNIDAINSIAYCVKFNSRTSMSSQTFDELIGLYQRSLAIDPHDVEANFNAGLLWLQQKQDHTKALEYFETCILKDKSDDRTRQVYNTQFAKAYYNIGMI